MKSTKLFFAISIVFAITFASNNVNAQVFQTSFIEKAGQTLPERFELENSWLYAWTEVVGSTAGAAAVLDMQADETIHFADKNRKELVIFSPLNELPSDSENPEDEFITNRNFSLQFSDEKNNGMCFKTREYVGKISSANVNVKCGQFINAEGTEMFFLVIRNLDNERNEDPELIHSLEKLNTKMFCNSGL